MKWFKNLKVTQKLLVSFLYIVVFIGIIGFIRIKSMNAVDKSVDYMHAHNLGTAKLADIKSNEDRKYKVSDSAEYFNSLITNGALSNPNTNLQVISTNKDISKLDFLEPLQIITNFQSGHGFSGNRDYWNLNDSSAYCVGNQSISVHISGHGGTYVCSKTGIAPFDTTGKQVRIRVRCDNVNLIGNGGIRIDFANDEEFVNCYEWIIQDIPSGILTSGDWISLILSFQDAVVSNHPTRNGITAVQVLVGDPDKGITTKTYFNLIELVPECAQGFASVTFDDGYESQYTLAKPILDSYGIRASVFPVCKCIGEFDRLTLDQLLKMQNSKWEIGVHAYSDAIHGSTFTRAATYNVEKDIINSRIWFASNGIKNVNSIAYPSGNINKDVINICKKYFTSGRTTASSNRESPIPDMPFRLRAQSSISSYNGGLSATTVQNLISSAATNKSWLILVFHNIVPGSPKSTTDCSQSDFNSIIRTLSKSGLRIMTINDVIKNVKPNYLHEIE